MKQKTSRIKAGTNAVLFCLFALGIIVCVNMLGRHGFARLDLTSQRVHTLSSYTKKMLNDLSDTVEIKVYLSENLPDAVLKQPGNRTIQITGLRQALKDKLDEYHSYGGKRLLVTYVKKDIEKAAKDQGISLFPSRQVSKGKTEVKFNLVAAGAVLYFKDRKEVVPQLIDKSFFENQITGALRKLLHHGPKKYVGFLSGHGEYAPFDAKLNLPSGRLMGFIAKRNPMAQRVVQILNYWKQQLDAFNANERKNLEKLGYALKRVPAGKPVPPDVELLMIVNPEGKFAEKDLYEIEQFMLKGKTVVLITGSFHTDLKNWRVKKLDLGIDDFLKHYGVRIERNLVLDMKSNNSLPIAEYKGGVLQRRDEPYPFFPMVSEFGERNILTRNFSNLTLPFASSITVLKRTYTVKELLRTEPSSFTWAYNTTTQKYVNYLKEQMIRQRGFVPPNYVYSWKSDPLLLFPRNYEIKFPEDQSGETKRQLVGVSIEGRFTSYFKGKKIAGVTDGKKDDKKKKTGGLRLNSGKGRLVVISSPLGIVGVSGDLVFEHIKPTLFFGQRGMFQMQRALQEARAKLVEIVELFRNTTTMRDRNRDFLLNLFDWGIAEPGLIEIRGKRYVFRKLDSISETKQSILKYASIVGVPLLFILLGLARFALVRRRREEWMIETQPK
ncbi:MAG: GldG family protein [Myxococcales bacterium]|nr:GldG family protein [Myxococcales bacterium]